MRTQLIDTAVEFLRDPKVSTAPMRKRVEFLEGKGLSSAEIEAAIAKAATQRSPTDPASNSGTIDNTPLAGAALVGPTTTVPASSSNMKSSSLKSTLMGLALTAGVGVGSVQLLKVCITLSII